MLHTIALEAIGDDWVHLANLHRRRFGRVPIGIRVMVRRPWVARITGLSAKYGFVREFVDGTKDCIDANRTGSRGVYIWYHLEDGVYEVNELITRYNTDRYFIRVQGGYAKRIGRTEVLQCLTQNDR